MLKHSRKFKLVPVEESEERDFNQPAEPPTPPVLTKLNMLDRELRNILEDSTLREKEKMEQYENTLMKWGKFYRQYQSAESGVRENNTLNHTINNNTSSNDSNHWRSTPNTDTSALTPIRFRSRSPVQRPIITPTDLTTPTGSPRSRSRTPHLPSDSAATSEFFTTPPSFRLPKKTEKYKKETKKKDRKLTPAQAVRTSRRLLERNGYLPKQIGSSWLPWHPRNEARRKKH